MRSDPRPHMQKHSDALLKRVVMARLMGASPRALSKRHGLQESYIVSVATGVYRPYIKPLAIKAIREWSLK